MKNTLKILAALVIGNSLIWILVLKSHELKQYKEARKNHLTIRIRNEAKKNISQVKFTLVSAMNATIVEFLSIEGTIGPDTQMTVKTTCLYNHSESSVDMDFIEESKKTHNSTIFDYVDGALCGEIDVVIRRDFTTGSQNKPRPL